jgi:hypothetical protein
MDVASSAARARESPFFLNPGVKYYLRVVARGSADDEEEALKPVCNVYRPDGGSPEAKAETTRTRDWAWSIFKDLNTGGSGNDCVVAQFPASGDRGGG